MTERLKKGSPNMIFIAGALVFIYNFYKYYFKEIPMSKLLIIAAWIYIFYSIVLLVKSLRISSWRIKEELKTIIIFVLIAIISFIIPILVHFIFFSSNKINEVDILNFYGSYITFLGTFGLGYVVYQRDKFITIGEKIKKAKLLHSCLNSVINQMDIVGSNPEIIKKIEYDPHWREYYYEISALGSINELYLSIKLEAIFRNVDLINYDLEQGRKYDAQKRYENFIKQEQYWPTKFNYIEVRSILYKMAYIWETFKIDIPWDDKEKIRQDIEKYGELFFPLIETWVWNYLLKHNIDYVEWNAINFDLVDWLMTNKELSELVITSYDKRIISAIVFNAALKLDKESMLLNFYWNTFCLKENKSIVNKI